MFTVDVKQQCNATFEITVKLLKIWSPKMITLIVQKNGAVLFYNAIVWPKDTDGMVNSVYTDQCIHYLLRPRVLQYFVL